MGSVLKYQIEQIGWDGDLARDGDFCEGGQAFAGVVGMIGADPHGSRTWPVWWFTHSWQLREWVASAGPRCVVGEKSMRRRRSESMLGYSRLKLKADC